MSQIKTKRSASKNPFYIMATIYGENTDAIDFDPYQQNRDVWNAWACQGLSQAEKDELKKAYLGLIIQDWTDKLKQKAEKAFAERLPSGFVPDHNSDIDFEDTDFEPDVSFLGFLFLKNANFRDAQFTEVADFRGAQFTEEAYFSSSRFEAHSYFQQAIFSEALDFTDVSFAQPTNFRQARFEKYYPIFEGTNLHGKTTLTAQPKYWPKATDHSQYEGADTPTLEKAAASCADLRHNMTAQGLPDDAHFFFRRETGCKLAMAGGVKKLPLWLYGKLSDYGYSYGRPLGGLIWLWLLWTLVYKPYFLSQEQVETLATKTTALAKAAGLSFANILAFFGFHSRFAEIEWSKASNWLIAFTGLETILGFILLFFLGLGLRNQFRLNIV